MQLDTFDRRTALKLLGIGGVAAAGTSVAATDEHDDDNQAGDHPAAHPMANLWIAHLRPQEDVQTKARGVAVFQPADGRIPFVLAVANVRNAFMAHIHEDEALGPIAVWLFDFATQSERLVEGRFTGLLDAGSITDDAIEAGRAPEASSTNLQDLLAKIEAGEAYVNLHTEAHPSGELAGRIEPLDWSAIDPKMLEWATKDW